MRSQHCTVLYARQLMERHCAYAVVSNFAEHYMKYFELCTVAV